VIVAPLEAIPPIDERYLADALESVPLIKGDNSAAENELLQWIRSKIGHQYEINNFRILLI
jgi:hypothetical protein